VAVGYCKFESVVRTGTTCSASAGVIVDRPENLRNAVEGSHYAVVVDRACDWHRKHQDSQLVSSRRCDMETEVEVCDYTQVRFEHRALMAALHCLYRSSRLHLDHNGSLGEW